jgi:hypothetical protein
MNARTIVITLAMCFVGLTLCFAEDANMGTWKLNEAKSKLSAGSTRNITVFYEAAAENVKVTIDGVDADGKPTYNEWTGKFDGKDYPVIGDPNEDTRSYKKIDDHTLELTLKKGGKVTTTGRIVVSADGKSRTVTTSGTDSKGKKFQNTAVYDKGKDILRVTVEAK